MVESAASEAVQDRFDTGMRDQREMAEYGDVLAVGASETRS